MMSAKSLFTKLRLEMSSFEKLTLHSLMMVVIVGRVQPRRRRSYSNASVGRAASAGARGSKNQFY